MRRPVDQKGQFADISDTSGPLQHGDGACHVFSPGVHEVTLFIRGEAETDGKTVFIVELTYGGIITINVSDPETAKPILLIEAPRHLFPFARGIVANVTRDGGFPPLLINPLDFAAMYIEQHGMPEGLDD